MQEIKPQPGGPGSKNYLISRSALWNQKLNPKVNEEFDLVSKYLMQWQNDEETVKVRKLGLKQNKSVYEIMMNEKCRKYNSSKPEQKGTQDVQDKLVIRSFEELLQMPLSTNKPVNKSIEELMAAIEPKKKVKLQKNSYTSSFKNIERKGLNKQIIYNSEIQYRPKYDFVHQSTDKLTKYVGSDASKIPFHDSRFDIFYGQDPSYTAQMLIEDELAGDWVYNDSKDHFKTPNKNQAIKRVSALKKLHKNYSQSDKLQQQKDIRDKVRNELHLLDISDKLEPKVKAQEMSLKNALLKSVNTRNLTQENKQNLRQSLQKYADEQRELAESSIDKSLTARTQSKKRKIKKISTMLNEKPQMPQNPLPTRESLETFAFDLNNKTRTMKASCSATTFIDFSRQQQRQQEKWMHTTHNPHEQRFGINLRKEPLIKKFGYSMLDLRNGQRGRAESIIIQKQEQNLHNFSVDKSTPSIEYDIPYQIPNSEYGSQFLKKMSQKSAKKLCDRFQDCQYKTIKANVGIKSIERNLFGEDTRPSTVDPQKLMIVKKQLNVNFENYISRQPKANFYSQVISGKIKLEKVSHVDFLPNSIQNKKK